MKPRPPHPLMSPLQVVGLVAAPIVGAVIGVWLEIRSWTRT